MPPIQHQGLDREHDGLDAQDGGVDEADRIHQVIVERGEEAELAGCQLFMVVAVEIDRAIGAGGQVVEGARIKRLQADQDAARLGEVLGVEELLLG